MVITYDGWQPIWVEFWEAMSEHHLAAANGFGNVGLPTMLGGVDFTDFSTDIAIYLLNVGAQLVPATDGVEWAEQTPGLEAIENAPFAGNNLVEHPVEVGGVLCREGRRHEGTHKHQGDGQPGKP